MELLPIEKEAGGGTLSEYVHNEQLEVSDS